MAVFRVKKTGNFTILSNYHLRDRSLSLKAKGLLSQILSLPDNWEYSIRGLACINKESEDAIRSAVHELEQAGYVRRGQGRASSGKMTAGEYTIYEHPRKAPEAPSQEKPHMDLPLRENPAPVNPVPVNPAAENPAQIKKEEIIKDKRKTEETSIESNPIDAKEREENFRDFVNIHDYEELLRENIEYDTLLQDSMIDHERVDELFCLMLETVCTAKKSLRIAGSEYPAELVRSRFFKLDSGHIRYVCECMDENKSRVRNIKKYLLAALFNAPVTMEHYYTAKVNYDFRDTG